MHRGDNLRQLRQICLGLLRRGEDLLPHGGLHNGDDINWLAHGEFVGDYLEDPAVLLPIEVLRTHQPHQLRYAAGIQQRGAQHRLLRLQTERQTAFGGHIIRGHG